MESINKESSNIRLEWIDYFKELTKLISRRSPCNRLKVGCILVLDNRIIATGYNGFLPGAIHKSIVRDNHEQATVHAEQNCITDCSKRGISTNNSIAYITHHPCIHCYKLLVSAGIKEINYLNDYKNDELIYELNKDLNVMIKKI